MPSDALMLPGSSITDGEPADPHQRRSGPTRLATVVSIVVLAAIVLLLAFFAPSAGAAGGCGGG
jgi:hypothetical protein